MANNSQKSFKLRKSIGKFRRNGSAAQEQSKEENIKSRRNLLIFGVFVILTLCVAGLANWRNGTFSNLTGSSSLSPNGAVVLTTPPALP
ncbi:MAG TPA: hypothetical protein VGD31_10515, partial [Sphingobacteriaceae bacterium]